MGAGVGHGLLGFEVCESPQALSLPSPHGAQLFLSPEGQTWPAHQPSYLCLDQQVWSPAQGASSGASFPRIGQVEFAKCSL